MVKSFVDNVYTVVSCAGLKWHVYYCSSRISVSTVWHAFEGATSSSCWNNSSGGLWSKSLGRVMMASWTLLPPSDFFNWSGNSKFTLIKKWNVLCNITVVDSVYFLVSYGCSLYVASHFCEACQRMAVIDEFWSVFFTLGRGALPWGLSKGWVLAHQHSPLNICNLRVKH